MISKLCILLIVFITGCTQPSFSEKKYLVLPDELSDCRFYNVDPGGLQNNITIVRCPNSSTTTQYTQSCGKNCTVTKNNFVIDGEEYIKKK